MVVVSVCIFNYECAYVVASVNGYLMSLLQVLGVHSIDCGSTLKLQLAHTNYT